MNQPIRSRRAARERALMALYSAWVGSHPADEALEMALEEVWLHPDTVAFSRRLLGSAWADREVWQNKFAGHLAEGWKVERLAVVDRASLVLASAELYGEPGIPPLATVTEWVKLARRYGHKDSGAFVHGVLAKVLADSPKAAWDPADEDVWEPEEEVVEAAEEVEVAPDDPELEIAKKLGAWVIRRSDEP
jgi:N utilization substance protein B